MTHTPGIMKRIRVMAAAMTALMILASCGNGDDVKTTITEEQAKQRVEDYVRQTLSALPAEARLEVLSAASSVSCDDPTDNGPKGRVTVGNTYWVRGLPKEGHTEFFDTVIAWWKQHNLTVLADRRPQVNLIRVENKQDGFRITFDENPAGDLTLGADSPCVWPNGTPAPRP
jgi:hypothetical protein